jgi:hypothetical protein
MSVNEFTITPPEKLGYKGSPDTQIHLTVTEQTQNFKVIAGKTINVPAGGTEGQLLVKASEDDFDMKWQTGSGGSVDSVNTKVGVVVLDPDDLDDTETTNKFHVNADWDADDGAAEILNKPTSFPATPAGNDTEVQYNDNGVLGSISGFIFDQEQIRLSLRNLEDTLSATSEYTLITDVETKYTDIGTCNTGYSSITKDAVVPFDSYLLNDGGNVVIGSLISGKDVKILCATTDHECHPSDIVATISDGGIDLRPDGIYSIDGVSIPTITEVNEIELQNIECHGTGLVNGGTMTPTGGVTFMVAPYIAYLSDGETTNVRLESVESITGLSTLYDGLNAICIDADNDIVILNAAPSLTEYVLIGVIYTALANTMIIEVMNTPVFCSNIPGRLANFATNAIRALIEDGCNLVEGVTPLTLKGSSGHINVNVETYELAETTSLIRMQKTADFGWVGDAINAVNPTVWNDITKNYGSELVTCTAGYWTKSLVYRSPGGTMYFVYGQVEYATEDLAKAAPMPSVPENVGNVNVYLAHIIAQKEDTSIGIRIYDIRPYLPRIFGYGATSSGVSLVHNSLIGLSSDDHTQYHTDARGDARYAPIAKGVTNGDSHDHNGGDGAQIDYTSLSNKPTLGTAAAENVGYFAAAAHAHEGTAIASTGETGAVKFLREDGDGTSSWQIPVTWDGDITDINLDGGTDIGAALADADLILVDDGGAGTNRKCAISRVKTYIGAATTSTKLDDFATPDDNTDLNANTTNHGLLVKATAPASGLLNVVGIGNTETAYTNKALFDNTNPVMNGTAAPGTAIIAARRDHIHATDTSREPTISKNTAFNQNFETSTSNIKMDGVVSVGALSTIPRADHIHATDTSREPTISPKNTAFNQNFETSTANIKMNGTVSVGALSTVPRADHVHASDTSKLDATRGNWKVFYSNGSGVVTELALGTLGYVLTSGGPSAAPTFAAAGAPTYGNWKLFHSNGSGVMTEVALGAAGTVLKCNGTSAAPTVARIGVRALPATMPDLGSAMQSLTASTLTLITGTRLALPTGCLFVGARISWELVIIKTAAGAATWTVNVRFGTNGTTADAAIATWTSGTNSAAIDQARLRITCQILTLGASATARCNAFYVNTLTSVTGLGRILGAPGSTATFNSDATNPYIHICMTSGASAVFTVMGEAEFVAMG